VKTVLVTGGAGYIGSHTCKLLAKAGLTPVTYDNLVYGHEWAAQWGPLERGDLLDTARLQEVLVRHRPDAVLHFAAYAYVGESVTNPGKYYSNNVVGSLRLLEALVANGVRDIVFSSTCATYGVPEREMIAEDHPQRPVNPYGASKLMVERMLADFGVAHGMRSICLRYFNAAGADEGAQIGEDHDPETHLLPLVLDAATGKRQHVEVFGADYDTPDGTCIRDYVHVLDLARAHILALQRLGTGTSRPAYNLGTGRGHSVLEVIDAVRRVSGREVPVRMSPRRAGDPPRLVANSELAASELGWTPAYTDLDETVRTAWNWHQRHWPSPGR
jgi:UDP-arabinose 4-epimerase